MKIPHSRHHWITVFLVLAASMLTVSEVYGQAARAGQGSGAAAVFEGRPAMSGAQAGTGAMAGPPQGGIGPQGSDSAERSLRRAPAGLNGVNSASNMPQGRREADAGPMLAAANTDMALRDEGVRRDRDSGIAKDERSAVTKGKRAVKRVVKRSRTGVGDIDAH